MKISGWTGWTETDTGYKTSDPDEINEFYNQQKSKDDNKPEVQSPLDKLKKEFLNYFGWGLNPENPDDRKILDEGSKHRVEAADAINEANKFLIINGALFFVGEGAAYCIGEFGGALLVRIVGKGVIQAAKGGQTIIARSVGAAPKGFSAVLQSGGHTLNNSTLKALGLTKEQGKIAIEALKTDLRLPANFHGKIMGNGDLVNPHTREVLGNLFDYLY